MLNALDEKTIARILFIGSPLVSLFLVTGVVTDPVNVTKMLALGGLGGALLVVILFKGVKHLWDDFKLEAIAVGLFILAALWSTIVSKSPAAQSLYGQYGRNTGFLTYLFLASISISGLFVTKLDFFKKFLFGLFFTGFINIIYCLWVLTFGDFIGWNNPYKKILGLLGNPDFISAFLGITIVAAIAYGISSGISWINRAVIVVMSSIALFEIVQSRAIQGLVVTAGGIAVIGFYQVRSRFKGNLATMGYSLIVFILGILAVFGTLQKGPLDFVYKKSVSLRGSYWHAGLGMGTSHPFTGVGLGGYGDWYRRTRPLVALKDSPGVDITSNVSHNVVIDFFASGGFPLVLSYLAIVLLAMRSIIKVTLRQKAYDGVFVSLVVAWVCYEVQSIISIDQIGLSIWGWAITGFLIAYESSTRENIDKSAIGKDNSLRIQKTMKNSVISTGLLATIGFVIGVFVTSPAINSDSKWFSALNSRNIINVEASLSSTYLNPGSTNRLLQAVDLFQRSGFPDQAYKYSKLSVEFNPDSFDSWKQLYYLPNATDVDKKSALENMKRLDPLNPDVTKIS